MGTFSIYEPPVSPEFILRPSLSGHAPIRAPPSPSVSPEFILRPSLSALLRLRCVRGNRTGVAGVYTPAFVERLTGLLMLCWQGRRVAGVILRPSLSELPGARLRAAAARVSPEFILRPSLSAGAMARSRASRPSCRRSLYSGLR